MNFEASTAATIESLGYVIPELLMTLTVILIILIDLLFLRGRAKKQGVMEMVVLGGVGAALLATCMGFGQEPRAIFGSMLVSDPFSSFFNIVFLLATILFVFGTMMSSEVAPKDRAEYYTLATGSVLGMMLMASATNLVSIVISVEFVSLASYVMAGFSRNDRLSTEASLKYVLYGSVSSAVMIFGLSYIYGLTGTLSLIEANQVLYAANPYPLTLLFALVLVIGGLGFKIACVPFHFWAPDVYEGSPTPVTAFFTVAPKAAGFALLTRFLVTLLSNPATSGQFWTFLGDLDWPLLVAIIAAGTMTLGNLAALRQENMKRLLAYSSIAHVGFVLMAVAVLSRAGIHAINVYMFAYLVMNLGAFLVVIAIQERTGSVELVDYTGLGKRAPLLAWPMVVFLYSLTGLPPSIGFMGKYYVFAEVIRQEIWWLAAFGAVNSVIALYYYFRVAKAMFFGEAEEQETTRRIPQFAAGISVALAVVTLVLGIPWSAFEQITTHSTTLFLGR